jgi:hypothetical protein
MRGADVNFEFAQRWAGREFLFGGRVHGVIDSIFGIGDNFVVKGGILYF